MRTWMVMAGLALSLVLGAQAQDGNGNSERYRSCVNTSGAGLFWVDSTTGSTWWADPNLMQWVSYGLPPQATPGPIGTYKPVENKSGEGVFVLNTTTGDGWWTNGKTWKHLGTPRLEPQAADSDVVP